MIMCWECDHPENTHQDYLDHMQGLIDRFGWAVVGLEGDRIHPAWAYTLGLTPHGKPELVVTGLPLPRATQLLNAVAPYVLDTAVPRPGEQVLLEGGPMMEVVRVAEPTAHLVTAVEFYGPRIKALQLTYADDRGHWPWCPGFRRHKGGQPVLGVRSAPPATAA
jgi:hypothetical protein